jgi:hypothetical protein
MKKILFGALLALAIASFGGTTILAHAQSVAGGQQATLQQQLELMKAKLQLLQLQQGGTGTQTVTPAVTPATVATPTQPTLTISASDASALNAALSALATTLVNLQSAIQSNPQFMAQNGPVVAQSLAGIEGSLAAVLTSIQTSAASAGTTAIAENNQPAQPAMGSPAVNSAPAAGQSAAGQPAAGQSAALSQTSNQGSLLPSVNSLTQPVNNTAAVASSALGGQNRLPAVIVGIILLAMIAILVWGRGGEELETAPARIDNKKSAPVAPVSPSISFVSNQNASTAPSMSPSVSAASPSPLASAMGQNQKKSA